MPVDAVDGRSHHLESRLRRVPAAKRAQDFSHRVIALGKRLNAADRRTEIEPAAVVGKREVEGSVEGCLLVLTEVLSPDAKRAFEQHLGTEDRRQGHGAEHRVGHVVGAGAGKSQRAGQLIVQVEARPAQFASEILARGHAPVVLAEGAIVNRLGSARKVFARLQGIWDIGREERLSCLPHLLERAEKPGAIRGDRPSDRRSPVVAR